MARVQARLGIGRESVELVRIGAQPDSLGGAQPEVIWVGYTGRLVPPDLFAPDSALIRSLSPTLAVLTAMITPAVLMSACGTMILSTSVRLGRVVDRIRDLSDRFQQLLAVETTTEIEREQQRMILGQLGQFRKRAKLLQGSLTTFYVAMGVFIATSMLIGLVAIAWVRSHWMPMAFALAGMGAMMFGSVLLILEARYALQAVYEETEFLWQLATKTAPTGIVVPERGGFSLVSRRRRRRGDGSDGLTTSFKRAVHRVSCRGCIHPGALAFASRRARSRFSR